MLGMSAILLPLDAHGEIDWPAFEAHVTRTVDAGLVPAVNMDTGYVQLLDPGTRTKILEVTAGLVGAGAATPGSPARSSAGSAADRFVAGAFVGDDPGDPFDADALVATATEVADHGGTPVVFPSNGLNALDDDGWVAAMQRVGATVDRFIGFELGPMFVPYGRIVGLDAYEALLGVDSCVGAKHSSLSRQLEWDRLAVRDRVRPDFHVFTGNDLAIDMITYGSDYLLGLSTFAPDLFAVRDRLWADDDAGFWEVNDLLQYLGFFTFRDPVPGYRHDAAMFLHERGWAATSDVPDGAPRRPDSDRAVLADIARRVEHLVEEWS